jgi:hypothetical protein
MLGLKIRQIEICVDTSGGRFFTSIPFDDGLNIIRADNSSGKSTCINAIAYALGLEDILGPIRKRPFPKSLYDVIYDNKIKESSYYVQHSFVSIVIENQFGIEAVLCRDIFGDTKKVSVTMSGITSDYFLGTSGHVGSSVSENGIHNWLAKFIGWELPNVVSFDGKEVRLYLECIFPLFFIEQKRGWSEIQANIPANYGIKNVKKSALEFCLGVDCFDFEKNISKLKFDIALYESDFDKLILFAENVAKFNDVKIRVIGDFNSKNTAPYVEFNYLENEIYVSIEMQELSLNKLIDDLSFDTKQKIPRNEILDSKLASLRLLRRKAEKLFKSSELMNISINDITKKIHSLNSDYDKYLQLKHLKNVGGDISSKLGTEKCPICDNDLYDTLGKLVGKSAPMSLDDNIVFLKNQLDFFKSIKSSNAQKLKEIEADYSLVKSKIEYEQEIVDVVRSEFEDIDGQIKMIIREKILAESSLKDVQKLKATQAEINNRLSSLHSLWLSSSESLRKLKSEGSDSNKGKVVGRFVSIMRKNLETFRFNYADIQSISISLQTLRPEQEGYDIVAETSASDYIRIIWAYTLTLMEIASNDENIKHGGFVVFDEPRQHETSKISFANLIDKASDSLRYGGQVIFATSLDKNELTAACNNKDIHLVCFDDYILKLQKAVS